MFLQIESLQNVLADCLIDDNVLVVKAMLSASPSFLSKIVTPKHLLSMLEKWWFDWCDELDLEIIDQLQAIVEAFDQVEVRILYLLFQFRYSKEGKFLAVCWNKFLRYSWLLCCSTPQGVSSRVRFTDSLWVNLACKKTQL